MRIGVNAVPLRMNGGGARYVFSELIERLLTTDDRNDYVIFAHPLALGVVNQLARVHRHLSAERDGRRARIIEVACEEEIFDHRDEFDLFFGPLNNLQPRLYDRPSVAILHDIQEQFYPQYFSPADLQARNEIYPEICRAATTLVTISQFCKDTIVDKFGIDAEKVEVVPNAPQSGLVDRSDDDIGRWSREPLRTPFFFYPANCYLHKNHALLLDLFERMRDENEAPPQIVFTGFELTGGYPLRTEIERRGLSRFCRVFDSVGIDELRYLYRHAVALLMPTRFEGFGMPAVEALACGCPIVCSDLPPLREICGGAALYFDPDDAGSLRTHLRTLLENATQRDWMIQQGRELSRQYSWDASARRFMEIFRDAPSHFLGHRATHFGEAARVNGRGQPRIGVLVNGTFHPGAIGAAVRSALATGYSSAVLRVIMPDGADTPEIADFLTGSQIRYETVAQRGPADWPRLARFARDEGLDLVGELIAGRGTLVPTAFHSVAWGWQRDAGKAVYFGEAWQQPHGRHIRSIARLRQLSEGFWKLEGFVYPEMMYLGVRALNEWTDGVTTVRSAGDDWRWQLLKAARVAGSLSSLRRTLAICDPSQLSTVERMRAAAGGVEAVYAADGRPGRGWLQRLKPVLKPASLVLPQAWRERGEQLWRHLTRA